MSVNTLKGIDEMILAHRIIVLVLGVLIFPTAILWVWFPQYWLGFLITIAILLFGVGWYTQEVERAMKALVELDKQETNRNFYSK